MKKTVLKLTTAAAMAVLLTACTTQPEKEAEADFRCKQNGQLAPKWTCNPYLEGSIVALGVAPKNAGNDYGMQRTEAMGEARAALASQLSVKVSTMFKSYKAITGSGAESTFDKANSTVTKQIASETLQGTKPVETWQSNDGSLYLLVGLNTEAVKNSMEEAVKTSFKNDKAMYQKFLAAKADGELDMELEKAGK